MPNLCVKYLRWHSYATVILTTVYVLYLILNTIVAENLTLAVILFGSILVGGMISYGFHQLVLIIMKCISVSTVKQAKVIVYIALINSAISGYAPRVIVCFVGWDFNKMLFTVFGSLYLSVFSKFQYFSSVDYKVKYISRPRSISILFGIHVVLLIASLKIGMLHHDVWDTVAICAVQILFTPLCLLSTVDLMMVVLGAEEVRFFPNSRNSVQPASGENIQVVERSSINCRICRLEFTSERCPRMFRECGHSVCNTCAIRFVAKHYGRYAECPFCHWITVVRGSIENMPKNYMLMDLVDEVKQKF
ncbi:hypothetical protein L3Y34_000093 [Caenorhabditis briggsae]|nr:hypothetical protein L3Y34_000093 [Caenorhabditis briggsae]